MTSVEEIGDRESLEAWLQGRDRTEAVALATRNALRVAPLYWAWVVTDENKADLTELPICRVILASAVAVGKATPETTRAAATAAAAAVDTADDVYAFTSFRTANITAAATAAAAAASAANDAVASIAFASTTFATTTAAANAAAMWALIPADCSMIERGEDTWRQPLWPDGVPEWWPEPAPHHAWPARGPAWQFWHDWYEGFLAGTPLPLDLLERVALIDNDVWKAGEPAVSAEIEAILLERAGGKARSGVMVTVNPDTGRFRQDDVGAEDPGGLAQAVAKLREIDALVESFGNLSGVLRAEIFLIRRAVNDHPDNPVMVHFNAGAARRILQGNLANGSCPSIAEEPVIGLIDATLVEAQSALWSEPEVREAAEKRAEDSPLLDEPEALKAIEEAAEEVAEVSEGLMVEELPEDARLARDLHQPRALRVEALMGSVSRLVQVWGLAYRGFKIVLDEAVDVTDKGAKITKNVGKIAKNVGLTAAAAGGTKGVIFASMHSDKVAAAIQHILALF